MKEILVDIKGYEGLYAISNTGFIFGRKRNNWLKFDIVGGYHRVTLCKDGKTERFMVHQLVAKHFLPNPDNKPIVHHKNHIGTDNRVENLEWVTAFENVKYDAEDGALGINAFKLSEDDVKMLRNMKATGLYTNKQLSHIFNINERNVRRIYSRETYREIE